MRVELTKDDWAQAVQWRPYVYKRIAAFGSKVMMGNVRWSGEIGQPTFQWLIGGDDDISYGVDARSILEDLEAPALEAAARAAHSFDEGRGAKFSTYLTKVVDNALRDAFNIWVRGSSSSANRPLEIVEVWEEPPFIEGEPESSLEPEVEAALQVAMGALTAKEAWALRMYADGVPVSVIQERLSHDRIQSTYALIKRAREKALRVMQDQLPEADIQ